MYGVNAISALTFGTLLSSQKSGAHRASDFRLKLRGNSPNFTVSSVAGQIGLFRPSPPARLSDRKPAEACFGFQDLQGVCRSCRPLSRPAPRSNKKNITDIRGADANRGPGPCPGSLCTPLDAGQPVSRRSSGRPLVTSLTHVSASDISMMPHHTSGLRRAIHRHRHHTVVRPLPAQPSYQGLNRWEPVNRLPPVT